MRRLGTSNLVAWALIGLYVCASLAAIPVPRLAWLGGNSDDLPAACSCSAGSGCCEGGSCCCGVVHDRPAPADERPALLVLGCEAKVKWYLASVPAFAGECGVVGVMEHGATPARMVGGLVPGSRVIEVPSPPPRALVA